MELAGERSLAGKVAVDVVVAVYDFAALPPSSASVL
jgi:hypothetical protein